MNKLLKLVIASIVFIMDILISYLNLGPIIAERAGNPACEILYEIMIYLIATISIYVVINIIVTIIVDIVKKRFQDQEVIE